MKIKLITVATATFGLAMLGLQGCFYSGPSRGYGGGYGGGPGYYQGYNAPAYREGPAYRSYGSTVGSCNPRNGVCMVCDSDGHHCHAVR
ncbi:MAG TPA: hypothetical protein VHS07_05565 [Candidatus Binataceae bacterium]|jgi:hypothetical protein|nr:hypothetical protein [Candidatus Binataceae bacterium]